MMGPGPSGLLMIAKERMQADQRNSAQWLEFERAKALKRDEDRLGRLCRLIALSGDLEGQIFRVAAWKVLSGRPLTLVELKKSVADPQAIKVLQCMAAHDLIELDETGSQIRGVGGITLVPTRWRVNLWAPVYARSLRSALRWFHDLAENGRIEGNCPQCQHRLSIHIQQGKMRRIRPKRHRTCCLVESLSAPSQSCSLLTIGD